MLGRMKTVLGGGVPVAPGRAWIATVEEPMQRTDGRMDGLMYDRVQSARLDRGSRLRLGFRRIRQADLVTNKDGRR